MAVNDVEIRVGATDTSQATLDRLREKLKELNQRVTSTIKVDDKAGQLAADQMKVKLDAIGRRVASPKIDIRGVDRAILDIERVDVALDKMHKSVVVRIREAVMAGAGKGLGGLAGVPALLAGGIGALGGASAIAAPLGAAGLALGAFGAVAIPVLTKVTQAQSALTNAQQAYAAATTKAQRQSALKAEAAAANDLTASQKAMMGPLQQLSGLWGKLENAMSPLIGSVNRTGAGLLKDLMPAISSLARGGGAFIETFLGTLGKFAKTPFFRTFTAEMGAMAAAIAPLISKTLAGLLKWLMLLFIDVMPSGVKILNVLLPALISFLNSLLPIITVGAQVLAVMVQWLAKNKLLVPALYLLVGAFIAMKMSLLSNPVFLIGTAIIILAGIITKYHKTIWEFITRIWGDIFGFVKRIWDDIWNFAKQWWPAFLGVGGLIYKYHEDIWQFILRIWNDVLGFLKHVWDTAWGDAKRIWGSIVSWFSGIPGRLLHALGNAGSLLYGWAKDAVSGVINGAKAVWHTVAGWFSGLPGAILHALGIHSPPDWAISAGKHIMQGLLSGITHKGWGAIKGYFTSLAGDITGPLKSVWNTLGGGLWKGSWGGAQVASWIKQALAITGAPGDWLPLLGKLVGLESGGNPSARNLTPAGIAAGYPEGIAQVTIGTFNAMSLPGHRNPWNPVDNLIAAIRHIMEAWGTIGNIPGLGSPGPYGGYASGGTSPGGWAMVGEQGRELVRLPRGSRVYPHGQSEAMMAGGVARVVVEFDFRGAASDKVIEALRKAVRVRGSGDVQATLAGI